MLLSLTLKRRRRSECPPSFISCEFKFATFPGCFRHYSVSFEREQVGGGRGGEGLGPSTSCLRGCWVNKIRRGDPDDHQPLRIQVVASVPPSDGPSPRRVVTAPPLEASESPPPGWPSRRVRAEFPWVFSRCRWLPSAATSTGADAAIGGVAPRLCLERWVPFSQRGGPPAAKAAVAPPVGPCHSATQQLFVAASANASAARSN